MTSGLQFSPAALSIAPGDTVIWTNASLFVHTSTSGIAPVGDGHWGSSSVNTGATFSVTFTNLAPQSYAYFCAFHYAFGMTGTLTITNGHATLPSIENPVWNNGQFQFTVNGNVGRTYITETSQDFAKWLAISTNVAPSDRFNVSDASATNHMGFYRVRIGF